MGIIPERRLVRESEWLRVFQLGDEESYVYESKFAVDNLEVPLASIKKRWSELSSDEKLEFALAFSCHRPNQGEDQEILEFLMEVGPEEVWRTIAVIVPFHRRADRALKFLLARTHASTGSRANYFQGIELLGGQEAVRDLRRYYDEYRRALIEEAEGAGQATTWMDYLQCTKALWTLTKDPTFLAALREGCAKAPVDLRSYASTVLWKTENH